MEHYYWHDWYNGWGWFLWFGLWVLMLSSLGNWGYSYKTYRKYGGQQNKNALDILNERYARGEIVKDDYQQMKVNINQ